MVFHLPSLHIRHPIAFITIYVCFHSSSALSLLYIVHLSYYPNSTIIFLLLYHVLLYHSRGYTVASVP